jgi:hypothetical protein
MGFNDGSRKWRKKRMNLPPPLTERPMRAGSRLERVLRSGRFAVTAEPAPDSADPNDVYKNALGPG